MSKNPPDTSVGLNRLSHLAATLQYIPPEYFSMASWASIGFNPAEPYKPGFTADAIGWACCIADFIGQGLTLRTGSMGSKYPSHISGDDWDAVTYFFDLQRQEAFQLFSIARYPRGKRSPKDVAKRIKDFINSKKEH